MAVDLGFQWDLLVDNHDGQLALVVEVKTKLNSSPAWATRFRRNLLAHGSFPETPYFLMVFPDWFYLWIATDVQSIQSEPTYTIDARPILQPYFKRAGVSAEQISGQSLEIIVAAWLGEIIHSTNLPEEMKESQHWLIESGLYAAISGGKVRHQAAA